MYSKQSLSLFLCVGIALAVSCNTDSEKQKQQTPGDTLAAKAEVISADTAALDEIYRQLTDSAKKARNNAYAPYSKFLAGAAVLGASGAIYTGCNVENASYGLTNCAERTAIFKAVSAGEKKIKAIAIVADVPVFDGPCGACRQVIYEFGKDVDVIMSNLSGRHKTEKITTLLPYAFGPESL